MQGEMMVLEVPPLAFYDPTTEVLGQLSQESNISSVELPRLSESGDDPIPVHFLVHTEGGARYLEQEKWPILQLSQDHQPVKEKMHYQVLVDLELNSQESMGGLWREILLIRNCQFC